MNISDEAVEAAAEWLPHSDDCEARPERDCTCWQPRVDLMRAALEAAAPHMHDTAAETRLLAIAWTEAYSAGFQDGAGFGPTHNPYRTAT